jgi:hypothetical protein
VVAEIMSRPIILTGDRLKSASGGTEMAEALVKRSSSRLRRWGPDHAADDWRACASDVSAACVDENPRLVFRHLWAGDGARTKRSQT